MNKAKLKSYAPQARKAFIAAVTARANLLGLSSKGGARGIAASQPQAGVTVIAGQAWPVKVHSQRRQLIIRIVPLSDELWFEGDGASRVLEFLLAVWGEGSGVFGVG